MLGNRKLVLDTHSEVYRELLPWADDEFWDIRQHTVIPGAVYIMCREQVNRYNHEIKDIAKEYKVNFISLENIVSAEFWGKKKSTTLNHEDEVDFMHFQANGHRLLAKSIRIELLKIH